MVLVVIGAFEVRAEDEVAPKVVSEAKGDGEVGGVKAGEDEPGEIRAAKIAEKADGLNEVSIVTAGSDEVHALAKLSRTVGGQNALIVPFPLTLKYGAANLVLKASGAVVWVTPVESADVEALEPTEENPLRLGEFLRVMQRVQEFQVYADGPVWLQYGSGGAAATLRADAVYFSVRKDGTTDPETGEPVFRLSGVVENARAHTSREAADAIAAEAGQIDPETGKPLVVVKSASTETEAVAAGSVNRRAAAEGAVVVKPEADIFELEKGRRFFVRAEQLKILSASSVIGGGVDATAEDASLSTSSLAIPSYSFASNNIRVLIRGTRRIIEMEEPGLAIGSTRVISHPSDRFIHDFDSRFPITRLDLSSSDAFGYYFRTRVDMIALYDYLWDPEPPFLPFELSPLFEWREKRGIATGLEFRTRRIPTFGSGWDSEFLGHYIGDKGDQRPEVASLGFYPLRSRDRGRFRGWARHRSKDGFALDLHGRYESDSTYLQEFFHGDFLSNEQEYSFARLRKDFEYRSYYLDVGIRGRDFLDEIERLPVFGFGVYGEPVGKFGLNVTSEGTVGNYRARIAQPGHPTDGRQVMRADFQFRIERPTDLRYASFVPYAGMRFTAADTRYVGVAGGNPLYDGSLGYVPLATDDYAKDVVTRAQLTAGAALQSHFVRTWSGAKNELLGINGLRHTLTPRIDAEMVVGPSRRSHLFMQMDEVDAHDSLSRVTYSVRNRFQTRRIRHGDNSYTTIDLLDVLLELPTYPNRHRDNNGERLGDIEARILANPSNYLQLRAGGFFSSNDGDWRRMYVAAAFPIGQLEATIYGRALRDQHEVGGVSLLTPLGPNYRLEFLQEYDFRSNSALDSVLQLSRSVAEIFSMRVSLRRNAATRDIAVSFSLGATFGP